jgi:hypothetical protein
VESPNGHQDDAKDNDDDNDDQQVAICKEQLMNSRASGLKAKVLLTLLVNFKMAIWSTVVA